MHYALVRATLSFSVLQSIVEVLGKAANIDFIYVVVAVIVITWFNSEAN